MLNLGGLEANDVPLAVERLGLQRGVSERLGDAVRLRRTLHLQELTWLQRLGGSLLRTIALDRAVPPTVNNLFVGGHLCHPLSFVSKHTAMA
jgi:hypothetical protein